jgi:hypothetical protein
MRKEAVDGLDLPSKKQGGIAAALRTVNPTSATQRRHVFPINNWRTWHAQGRTVGDSPWFVKRYAIL